MRGQSQISKGKAIMAQDVMNTPRTLPRSGSGSNPFARSKFIYAINGWYRLQLCLGPALLRGGGGSEAAEEQFGSGFRLPSPSPVLISIPVVALRSEELRVPPSAVLVFPGSL